MVPRRVLLLAIVFALKAFRAYIWGSRFKVLTDHKALAFMFSQKKTNELIDRWFETLLDFDFEIIHCPGISHVLPDALSRFYDADPASSREPSSVENVVFSQLLAQELETIPINSENTLIAIDSDTLQQENLIKAVHLLGHAGAYAMVEYIRKNENRKWKGMLAQCQTWVDKCIPCQRFNISAQGFNPQRSLKALLPFDHVAVDSKSMPLSYRGYVGYMVLIDVATRFCFVRPIKDLTAYSIARELWLIFCDVGFPRILQHDNGPKNVNAIIKELLSKPSYYPV